MFSKQLFAIINEKVLLKMQNNDVNYIYFLKYFFYIDIYPLNFYSKI